jgi:predicted nucleic-acid-binding protein
MSLFVCSMKTSRNEGQRAETIFFRQAINAGGVWLAPMVLVEVAWVLRSACKFDRSTITHVLRSLADAR